LDEAKEEITETQNQQGSITTKLLIPADYKKAIIIANDAGGPMKFVR